MAKVVVDPITRIEGHYRIEAEVEGGKVKDAWASSGLYRGMETVLKGREPADAFFVSQRICGVCPIPHGHASTMSTEAALGIKIPDGARLVRNIIEAAESLHSHILWFYTLTALDYVDPVKALSADIADTYALAAVANTSTADFGAIKARLAAFVGPNPDMAKLSIFSNLYAGHPAIPDDIPAELHLIAVAHYLEALEMQAEAAAIIACMGGKFPHFMTSLPGGTTWMPTEEKLDDVLFRYNRVAAFVNNTLIPDTLAIAPFYKSALAYGKGVGNFLAWGVFDDASADPKKRALPRGMIVGGDLSKVLDPDVAKVTEDVTHAWYSSPNGLNPKDGQTVAKFTEYKTDDKYTYVKAPRYDGKPMEVGPLARMAVALVSGNKEVKALIDTALKALEPSKKPETLYPALVSLLGRVAARNLEAAYIAQKMGGWITELVGAVKGGEASFFTESTATDGQGAGLWEAPRGALGHFINVKGGKIENYQVVSPSTWNCCGRDKDGVRGPVEEALIGCPVEDAEKPLEIMRIVHSFDP